jgi:putative membrane protein
MKSKLLFGAVSAAVLVLGACADNDDPMDDLNTPSAQTTGTYGTTGATGAAAGDQQRQMEDAQTYVNAAAQAGLAEIETSRMALQRANMQEVKDFAQKIIDDHTASSERLIGIVTSAGLTPPPTTLDDFHMRRVNDLNEEDGDADFDEDYLAAQVDMHDDAIALHRSYAQDGGNAQLTAFANETLPVLEQHRMMAEQLLAAARGNAGGTTGGADASGATPAQ